MNLKTRLLLTFGLINVMGAYSYWIMFPYTSCFSADGNPAALGLTFGYDVETVIHFISVRTEDSLGCYHYFLQVWDSLFPLVYTAFFLLWIRVFYPWRAILLIPFFLIAADLGENFTELSMIDHLLSEGEIDEQLVQLGSLLTQAKWTLALLNVLLFAFGSVRFWLAFRAKRGK